MRHNGAEAMLPLVERLASMVSLKGQMVSLVKMIIFLFFSFGRISTLTVGKHTLSFVFTSYIWYSVRAVSKFGKYTSLFSYHKDKQIAQRATITHMRASKSSKYFE